MVSPRLTLAVLAAAFVCYWLLAIVTPVLILVAIGLYWWQHEYRHKTTKPTQQTTKAELQSEQFYYQFFKDFMKEINEQITIVDKDLGQLKGILGDATGSLSNTVLNVENDTNSQWEALEVLIKELMEATSVEKQTSMDEESSINVMPLPQMKPSLIC